MLLVEGVGLGSYLLIGYWFKNTEYNNAAKKHSSSTELVIRIFS